ncbi:glycosyltransferase family 9 protein [uncultured Fusobacterium sp.]|uniref:glycosyltransferase family 9 protein n=1 Tax=uncultured Fusobacterium sp. TaxID=159267 RepID=UPI0025D777DD|nr:glycosyltransferase family 9 protein [uncultured Fusobacterium sp.]
MKILVVRFKQIGDAILSSVICNTLKRTFPEAEIDYVVYEHISPLFENHKYIDNVISITKEEQKNPFKYLAKVWKVTRKKYDIVIDIMSTPKSEVFTLFSLGSRYRIGRRKPKRGYTYNYKIDEPRDAKDKVDKFLKMLKPLEQEYKVMYDNNYIITLTFEEKSQMRKRMLDAGIDFNRPVYICAANSRRESKIYNIEKMKKIVERVRDELKGQIIFFYSPDEKDFIMKFYEKFENKRDLFVNINTKSIRELAMVIANCNFFFGNEGGPRHLAQSLDIPSFAIFSPSASKKEWLSNANERHQGVEPNDVRNCEGLDYKGQYNLIDPDYVFDKIEEMSKKFIAK